MKWSRHLGQHLCAIPFPCFIQLLSITALKVHYVMLRDELLPTAVGKTRVQGLVCTRTQYQWGIVGCRTACSSIAMLLGTTLTCGTLALIAYSILYATCVATMAHAIFGADNNANGATFSEVAKVLQLSNHLEVASLASLFPRPHNRSSLCIGSVALLCSGVSMCFLCASSWGYCPPSMERYCYFIEGVHTPRLWSPPFLWSSLQILFSSYGLQCWEVLVPGFSWYSRRERGWCYVLAVHGLKAFGPRCS